MRAYLVSTGVSTAVRGYWSFISSYLRVLSPQGCFKHWQQNINKTVNFDNKTFTFESKTFTFESKLSLLLSKMARKFSQMPQHSSNPLQAPPARLFSAPSWLAGWQRVGGTSSLVCDDGGALLHGELVLVDGHLLQKEHTTNFRRNNSSWTACRWENASWEKHKVEQKRGRTL